MLLPPLLMLGTSERVGSTLAAYTASDPVHIVETSEEEVTDLGALAGHPGNLHGRIPPAEADRMHDVEDIFAGTLD